jgi:hypothetical protein
MHSHSALVGLYLGALHGLVRAAELGFRDRTQAPSPAYARTLGRMLRRLGHGKAALQGQWLAGFYFNDAMFRLAALYERGLKAVVGSKGREDIPCLRQIAEAKGLMNSAEFSALDAVRRDVNALKHRDGLVLTGRTVPFDTAVAAAIEGRGLLDRVARKVIRQSSDV